MINVTAVSQNLSSRQPSEFPLLKQSNYVEQIRLIVTHPFFTGQCPQCKQKLTLIERTPGQCHCAHCGWSDQEEVSSSENVLGT
jgi:predicted amidophosphoribosyltransferase